MNRGATDREISRPFTLENATDVDAEGSPWNRKTGAIAHQPACGDGLPVCMDCRQSVTGGQRDELLVSDQQERIATHQESLRFDLRRSPSRSDPGGMRTAQNRRAMRWQDTQSPASSAVAHAPQLAIPPRRRAA